MNAVAQRVVAELNRRAREDIPIPVEKIDSLLADATGRLQVIVTRRLHSRPDLDGLSCFRMEIADCITRLREAAHLAGADSNECP